MSKTLIVKVAACASAALLVGIVASTAVGGVVGRSIPDSSGVIHACYKASGSQYPLGVLNTSLHPSCPSGYKTLKWDASPPGIGVATGGATAGTTPGATCTLGEISLFAQHGAYLPLSYVAAKGQSLSISSNTALFTLLGTTYGGDGKSTFGLPNLQSLAPNHMTYGICVSGYFP
jgi:hypothetical protein